MEVGLRVIKGPAWKETYNDDILCDVGTVVEVGKGCSHSVPNKAVVVLWDCGTFSTCRVGCCGVYDLRIFDNAPTGTKHRALCDICGSINNNIFGIRWKCKVCRNFDLCTKCYMFGQHDISHVFIRFETAESRGVEITSRRNSVQTYIRGIFVGAKVAPGYHFNYQKQRGFDYNSGTVIGIDGAPEIGCRNTVVVTWHSKVFEDSSNTYRLGFEGKVDLKCSEAALWGSCYEDHLPLLGKNEECSSCNTESCCISLDKNEQDLDSQTFQGLLENNNQSFLEVLSTDLLKQFESKSGTDCCLRAGGITFPAHRFILSMRSPVFEAMFRLDTAENESGQVNILDVEPNILEHILYYMYSGKIKGLSEETAAPMYGAADKYELLELRDICMHFLIHNLTLVNITDAINLAYIHADTNLRREVIYYLGENIKEVAKSDKWNAFVTDKPKLVIDVLTEALIETNK